MKEFVCKKALPSDEQPFRTKHRLNYDYFLLYLTNFTDKPIIPIDLVGNWCYSAAIDGERPAKKGGSVHDRYKVFHDVLLWDHLLPGRLYRQSADISCYAPLRGFSPRRPVLFGSTEGCSCFFALKSEP